MKREITILQDFCDVCGKESNKWSVCQNCGTNICYDCQKTNARKYNHGVHSAGSGDGLYCLPCDATLITIGDKKHAAYRVIKALADEGRGWSVDFDRRVKKAEMTLEIIQKGGSA